MIAHMQINSPELMRQYRESQARRKRLSGGSKQHAARLHTPSPPAPVLAEQANAHIIAWQSGEFYRVWRRYMDDRNVDLSYRVLIDDVIRVVSNYFRVSKADILSHRRTANVVKPRQIAMYLAKVLTLRSLPEIGRRFGGRDHTTILHAVRKIDRLLATDHDLAQEIGALRRLIGGADAG